MNIRPARSTDISAICDIYNRGIESGTGTFETQLRTPSQIESWLQEQGAFPLLIAELDDAVAGFARLSEYRTRPCYRGIAEFSVYLDLHAQGKGVGTQLVSQLLESAKICGFHKVIARIFTFNAASRALCKKLGFREVGIYERHGQLAGKWLDVVVVERLLHHH
ncbi:N-acetyltransferase [Alteromonas aestuariivivens]|uniref:N-acetyltransferase n=1 Tax=Alteromonas aestuariivivens TaxID=1938339 RepID=A0A3D8M3C8_9ALTE|nr:arsinothricin resistance N-acetyltransferase ArsN1 family A [Alteromonas aestuariivivens]RDV24100.1 N-acetyltransferase [Alteromonas aestuariivivens]